MQYRPHRGSLEDSMKGLNNFDSFEALCNHLYEEYPFVKKGSVKVEPYGFDKRNQWDTFSVSGEVNGSMCILGFTDKDCK